MPTVETRYLGDLRTEAVHVKSGTIIQTDAPVDNQGKGELFSPSDLVAAALASCMMTIMGIVAARDGLSLTGTSAETQKIMSADLPRKIARIEVKLVMTSDRRLTDAEKLKFEKAAYQCPVALSLHPDIEQIVSFEWLVQAN
jgi:putative redox protein